MVSCHPSGSRPRILASSISANPLTNIIPLPTTPYESPRRIGEVKSNRNSGSKLMPAYADGTRGFTWPRSWRPMLATHSSLNHRAHFLQYRWKIVGEENAGWHRLHAQVVASWEFYIWRCECCAKMRTEGYLHTRMFNPSMYTSWRLLENLISIVHRLYSVPMGIWGCAKSPSSYARMVAWSTKYVKTSINLLKYAC